MMKKLFAYAAVAILAVSAAGFSRTALADKNSPPDESIPINSPGGASGDVESESARAEREKREAEAKAARAAKEAEAGRARERAAAEAKKKEAARMAEEAERAAEASRRAASEDQANRLMRTGMSHMSEGRYQMALNSFRSYTGGNPNSADAWYWIARAHHALGDYDKAQAAVNIALEIDP
jgi:tetratricopeptide (TPR) repeat protein